MIRMLVGTYRDFNIYYSMGRDEWSTEWGLLPIDEYTSELLLHQAINRLLDQTPVPPDPDPDPVPDPYDPFSDPTINWTLPVFRKDQIYTNIDPVVYGPVDEYNWAVTIDGGNTYMSYAAYVLLGVEEPTLAIIPVEVVVGYVTSNWSWISSALKVLGKIFLLDEVVEWLQGPGGEGITNLDDMVARIFSGAPGQTVTSTGEVIDVNPDAPKLYPVNHVRQGWRIKRITTYTIPEGGNRTVKGSKKVWHKDFNSMSFAEKAGKFQGQRAQAYDSRQAKNAAYVRGFNNGAKAQQTQEKTVEAGGTALVTYSRRR